MSVGRDAPSAVLIATSLARPTARAEEQVRQVRAGDQQNQSDGTKQQQQSGPCVREQPGLKRNRVRGPALHSRERVANVRLDGLELRRGLLPRHARLETAEDGHAVTHPVLIAEILLVPRGVDFAGNRRPDVRRQDANNRVRQVVSDDAASDDGRVAARYPLPGGVAEDEDAILHALIGSEIAAEQRLRPDEAEKVGADAHPRDLLGLAVAGQGSAAGLHQSHVVERAALGFPVEEIRPGRVDPRPPWLSLFSQMIPTRSGSGYGIGRIRTAFTTLNMAEFAPMPSARTHTVMAAKAGLRRMNRNANRTCCRISAMPCM